MCIFIITRLELGFTLRRVLAVFMHSAITPPKVNRFGWNLEHSENTIEGWTWSILGAIRAAASAGEPGKIVFFLSGKQTHDFTDFPSAKFHEI